MALKEGKVNQEKAERNKAVLKKLHQSPGFIEKVQEGYAQIERGESVTVSVDAIKNKLKIVTEGSLQALIDVPAESAQHTA